VITAGPSLDAHDAARLRRRAIFDFHKYDPQFGDVSVLAPFALRITPSTWRALSTHAEALAREMLGAERALLRAPSALRELDLPRSIRALLATRFAGTETPTLARFVRFDFHETTDGWRISEANSDVPGGFIEASGVAQLMLAHHARHSLPGDPAEALADALASRLGEGARVALVHATAYTDDRQVMLFLRDRLRARGVVGALCSPAELAWRDGHATLRSASEPRAPLDGVLRFYPGEWLPRLLLSASWWRFFRGGRTPVTNPGVALASQSKRFPLTWDRLDLAMPTWRALLPETRDPRASEVRLASGEWVLKPVLGRVGEGIGLPGVTGPKAWRECTRDARRRPRAWIAQRAFETRALETPLGLMYPCLGVFVIDGKASGVYGRLGRTPLVDGAAMEAAVLIDERSSADDLRTAERRPRVEREPHVERA
jgi:glutathionylspermidine synthase